MAAPDTTVKYFHSGMTGAPVLSGTVGALIAVLDACLVNGFGTVTLDSLVVAGGIATATRSAGISFEKDAVVLAAGATPAGLNGEKRLLSVSSTQFTFDATGISDQTATGTITVKLAPAGWEKQYAGTNLAAYRSLNIAATHAVLRVDDTVAQTARVVGYESMADVNSGTNPFPTTAQQSGGLYWVKSAAASATARDWIVVADSRFLYYMVATGGSLTACAVYCFGDGLSLKTGDAYSAAIYGDTTSTPTSGSPGTSIGMLFYAGLQGGFLQRDAAGLVASQPSANQMFAYGVSNVTSGQNGATYPSGIHGALIASKLTLRETNVALGDIRHVVPGAVFLNVTIPAGAFLNRTKITGQGDLLGRTLYAIELGGNSVARAMIDISGPWR